MNTIKTTLFPTDLSAASLQCLREAGKVAASHSARLLVLHVLSDTQSPAAANDAGLGPIEHALHTIRGEIERHVQGGLDIDIVLRSGEPLAIINEVVGEEDVDLLVLGRHAVALNAQQVDVTAPLPKSLTDALRLHPPCAVVLVNPPAPRHSHSGACTKCNSCRQDKNCASRNRDTQTLAIAV